MKKLLSIVMVIAMTLSLAACGGSAAPAATTATAAAASSDVPAGLEDGVLTIAMECAYAPYNWTQSDDSNGAVPIANVPGSYANGYDVMIGKKIAEANGWQLEVIQSDWDSLVHDRRACRAGGFCRPLLLRHHRLRDQGRQQVCQCQVHRRSGRRLLHRPDRHHLV